MCVGHTGEASSPSRLLFPACIGPLPVPTNAKVILALPRISSMVKHIEACLFIKRKATSHDERFYVA